MSASSPRQAASLTVRWLLREAVHCGLKLEAVGVCLQSAIHKHPAVSASGLIPDELIKILNEELRGETVEFETETRVRAIVDQFLPHSRLVEIIELATKYDAGPSTAPTTAEDGKTIEDAASAIPPPKRLNPLALGPDALSTARDSLRGAWWLLEGLILQTRKYEGNKDTGRDVWR